MKELKALKAIVRPNIAPMHDLGGFLRTCRSLTTWPTLERRRRSWPNAIGTKKNVPPKARNPTKPGRSAIASTVLVSSSCVDTVLARGRLGFLFVNIFIIRLFREGSLLFYIIYWYWWYRVLFIESKPSCKGSQRMNILIKSKSLHHWFIFRVCGNTLYMHHAHQLLQE